MAKILVVDDNEISRKWFKSLFGHHHSILIASDGIEAMKMTLAEKPDVIFLDTDMPRMNGYQACQIIKQTPNVSKIPIIFLCDKPKEVGKHLADKMGAFDCLPRPLDEKIVSDSLKRALESIKDTVFEIAVDLGPHHPDLIQFKQKYQFSDALMNFIKNYINSEHKLQILLFFYENKRTISLAGIFLKSFISICSMSEKSSTTSSKKK